jgi:hypothetical protein
MLKEHNTHSYTNNKGHITHNEYKGKQERRKKKGTIIPVTGLGDLQRC